MQLQEGRNYRHFREAFIWEQYILFLSVFLYDGTFAERGNYLYSYDFADMWPIYIDRFMEWVDEEDPAVGCKIRISNTSSILYQERLEVIAPYLEELGLIRVWEQPGSRNWEACWEIEAQPLLEMVFDLYENTDIEDVPGMDGQDAEVCCAYEVYTRRLVQGRQQGSLLKLFRAPDAQSLDQSIDLEVSVRNTDCIRVIRMNLKNSLYDLHRMILKAVGFDDDHLFEFYIGSGLMKRTYTLSEVVDSGRKQSVEETSLGDLELCRGQKFMYLFDFGDMWWFDIKVLEISEGAVEPPKVIKAVNDAPEQYPDYEEEMDGWQVEISGQVQVSDILSSIDDELIREEYAALMGIKDAIPKESPALMRRDMERVLLQNPDRMLTFMTAEMRKALSELLREEWIDVSEKCTLCTGFFSLAIIKERVSLILCL